MENKMTHKIDNKIRFLVIYQDVTKNVNSIVRYTGIPERTVRDWVTKTENGQDILTTKSGRGRKQTIEEEKEEDIANQVREDPYKASLRRLGPTCDVSYGTIGAILHNKGFEYKKVKVGSKLLEKHKIKRVEFCQKMLKDPYQMNRIWFSDEMGFNLQEVRSRVWTDQETFDIEKLPNEKVNAWAAISFFGKTSLHLYEENLGSEGYLKILEAHSNELVRADWRKYKFQQDNAPLHWTDDIMRWFEEKGIELLQWPSNSPDLNPIENIWGWIKAEVKRENPKTMKQLRNSLQKNWERIDLNFIKPYVESLPRRFELYIENGGERINY